MAYSSINDPKLDDDDDDYPDHWREEEEGGQSSFDGINERFPNYSTESKNAGRFLGLDHPYVPGDPDL